MTRAGGCLTLPPANLREALELYFEDDATKVAMLPTRTYQFGEVAIDA